MRRFVSIILCLVAILVTGCNENESALHPAGPQAIQTANLWWFYFYVVIVIYGFVLVAIFLAAAVRARRKSNELAAAVDSPSVRGERIRAAFVSGALILTVATLFVLLIADYVAGRNINALSDNVNLKVRVIGHQWWWEVRYDNPDPTQTFTTANEIHLPIGKTVDFELDSTDVIHSFWVPNLHGKRDLIPGHPTHIFIEVDEPGTYLGQCAEFCGLQHANMRLAVVAEPQRDFDSWRAQQLENAVEPQTDPEKAGQRVFLSATCVMCHEIAGTPARASFGPSLTHVASRARIGTNMLENTVGHLGGWIIDPQEIKPGVRMPVNPLKPEDLRALLEYLQSLK
jgi:cytochrome c oxidase subunit 2